jgi:hypothetical protein
MTTRRTWPYVAAALLLLTACTSPDSASAPSPTPKPLFGIKPPNTHLELRAALPTTFAKLRLELESGDGDPGYSARGDLFKGRKVEPEVPAPYGEKWLDLYPAAAPQCADMRIDGAERASIIERSIPGLGTRFALRAPDLPAGRQGASRRPDLVRHALADRKLKR